MNVDNKRYVYLLFKLNLETASIARIFGHVINEDYKSSI